MVNVASFSTPPPLDLIDFVRGGGVGYPALPVLRSELSVLRQWVPLAIVVPLPNVIRSLVSRPLLVVSKVELLIDLVVVVAVVVGVVVDVVGIDLVGVVVVVVMVLLLLV